ncbi:2-amino-4-hydroxy-6-hydroxymethyldihydropteridine diphosphokinase [Actinotalea sp. JY-7885]|uniref:2-amino-4-hydroxy-6- hydroxymethyldihydropteridine diphosphokinase n=1 Tax=Actinotalea sp. JY-7885 TaxID=2758576 RepID=UPI002815C937|nr:2-amino-4-hydroxy-6-hydroxymethyldihydropteridine diphosphokinase [Actinotalea sp. JY-7885]
MHEPTAGPHARDRITVSGIAATGHHGVFEHERRDGQTFVADVTLHVDTRPAAAEDRLDLTVHYGVLSEQVAAVLSGEPADLVETVAERIAAVALAHPAVAAVDVVVHKPQAPLTVPFTDVTVQIHRDRTHAPVVAAPHVGPGGPGELPGAPADLLPEPVEATALFVPDWARVEAALVPVAAHARPATEHAPDTGPVLGTGAGTGVAAGPVPGVEPEPADRLDAVPAEPVDVVLALGSNLGASHDTLRQVVHDLAGVPGLEVTAVAPLARTQAVGGPEQADFLNTVVLARTTLSPRALLHACQEIEDAHGRVRTEHWGPRTIDVDLIVHGSTVAAADDLELPHPRAHARAFVLEPWAQVDPGAVLPGLGGGPVAALAQTAPDRGGIRWMALDWWSTPQ